MRSGTLSNIANPPPWSKPQCSLLSLLRELDSSAYDCFIPSVALLLIISYVFFFSVSLYLSLSLAGVFSVVIDGSSRRDFIPLRGRFAVWYPSFFPSGWTKPLHWRLLTGS
jgi:hypothetical protein